MYADNRIKQALPDLDTEKGYKTFLFFVLYRLLACALLLPTSSHSFFYHQNIRQKNETITLLDATPEIHNTSIKYLLSENKKVELHLIVST